MKVSKIIKGILAASLALAFVGCKFDFKPTAASFDDKEYDLVSVQNELHIGATLETDLSVTPISVTTVASDTQFVISITSKYGLDEDSIDEGVNFQPCSKNPVLNGAVIRGDSLAKEKLVVDYVYPTDPNDSASTITTKVTYLVNTASITTNEIAVFFDATKIKDKKGTLILNNNSNETLGEETDSVVKYIDVTFQADGSTAAVDITYNGSATAEDFCPELYLNTVTVTPTADTGKYKVEVLAPIYYDTTAGHPNADLADIVKALYIYQTRALDATSWTDIELPFAYDGVTQYYTAEVDLPADLGSEYRLVYNRKANMSSDKNAAYWGNHAEYVTFKNVDQKDVVNNSEGTVMYYKVSPEYIAHTVDATATSAATFTPSTIANSAIGTAQNDLMTVSLTTAAPMYWEIEVPADRPLKAIDGFKVFDKYGKEVEFETQILSKKDNGTIKKFRVAIKEKYYYSATTKLYVGKGTTLDSNVEYPSEVEFGCLNLRKDTYHKGLVEVTVD